MSKHQTLLILDFGSQYTQLIARRVREQRVFCEIHPFNYPVEEIRQLDPIGIVLSGGPESVLAEGAPEVDPALYELGIPILGVCYGMQLLARDLGGQVVRADEAEVVRDPQVDGAFAVRRDRVADDSVHRTEQPRPLVRGDRRRFLSRL